MLKEGKEMYKHIMLARQAIYDRDNALYGFELLYRNDLRNEANIANGFSATSELLINLCTNAFEEKLTANHPLFINFDEAFILSDSFFPGPANNTVLEVLETVQPTGEVLKAIRGLRAKGFQFALDDYVFEAHRAPFLPLMSIIKIDVLAISPDEISQKLPSLQDLYLILLAEKVEDQASYEHCMSLGFQLFQGYYLERPKLHKGSKLSASKLVAVRLLSELCRDDITVDEVSDLISCDPRFVIKLIKIVNCPLYPFKREIENIREAIILLGLEVIKQWGMVLVLIAESEQPKELFRTLLVRAKTCENLSKGQANFVPSDCFTLGLFSGIDAVLQLELSVILEDINLASPLRQALLYGAGDYGKLLADVRNYEANDESELCKVSTHDMDKISDCHQVSVRWADQLMQLIV